MNRLCVGLLLTLIWVAALAMSESEQEELATRWVQVFNTADQEQMASFRSENFEGSESDWADEYSRWTTEFGPVEIYGYMRSDETLLIGTQSENAGRVRFEFAFVGDKIASVTTQTASESNVPRLQLSGDWNDKRAAIDQFLTNLSRKDLFAGTVMVVERGEVLFRGAYGLASREFNAANTLDTRFDVGSFNKDYTRLAILQLMEQGKLSRSDTVGQHLPDYPNPVVRDQVTIDQLLFHRSGLGDYFTEEWFETPMQNLQEIDDYLPIWGPKPLLHAPGERERYSNFGYTVLGAIVEKLSGQSYPDYVMEHVFQPAGMMDSGFFGVDQIVPNVAVGYTRYGREGPVEELYKNTFLEPVRGGPWGKSYSTIDDLYRFYAAMFEGKLISEPNNWLRSGWDIQGMALAGGGPGLNASLEMQGGFMVLAMANLDPPSADQVAMALLQAVSPED